MPDQTENSAKAEVRAVPAERKIQQRDRGGRRRQPREDDEYDQRMIDLARVTRVMAGGKRMRFRVCMVIGDRKGKVGWGVAKGSDVSLAIQKAVAVAKKNMISVGTVDGTIPHQIQVKFKAAKILLKPAKRGKGLIAGGVVRTVLDLAGVENIVSKIFGSNNKINNVAATFKALSGLRRIEGGSPAEKTAAAGVRNKQHGAVADAVTSVGTVQTKE